MKRSTFRGHEGRQTGYRGGTEGRWRWAVVGRGQAPVVMAAPAEGTTTGRTLRKWQNGTTASTCGPGDRRTSLAGVFCDEVVAVGGKKGCTTRDCGWRGLLGGLDDRNVICLAIPLPLVLTGAGSLSKNGGVSRGAFKAGIMLITFPRIRTTGNYDGTAQHFELCLGKIQSTITAQLLQAWA